MGRGCARHRRTARGMCDNAGPGDRALPRIDRALQVPAECGHTRHAAAAVGRGQGAEDRAARAVLGGAGEAGELVFVVFGTNDLAAFIPANGAVIKSSPRHLPPNGTGFGIDDGCFSRPVVELAVREPAKAPLNWPFGTHKIGAGDLITAPFAGMTMGSNRQDHCTSVPTLALITNDLVAVTYDLVCRHPRESGDPEPAPDFDRVPGSPLSR